MNIGLISYFLQSPHRFRVRHGECAGRERLEHAMSDGELVRHFGGVAEIEKVRHVDGDFGIVFKHINAPICRHDYDITHSHT